MTRCPPAVACASFITRDESVTMALAATLGQMILPGEWLALMGELGAGKTRFVRGVCAGLGVDTRSVASPTYVLMRVYACAESGSSAICALAHIDAFRLRGAPELDTVGLDETLARQPTVVAVEWADHIAEALPPLALRIEIEHAASWGNSDEETRRRITMLGDSRTWRGRLAALHCLAAK